MSVQSSYFACAQGLRNSLVQRFLILLAATVFVFGCTPRPSTIAPLWKVDPGDDSIAGFSTLLWDYAPQGTQDHGKFAMDNTGNLYVAGFESTTVNSTTDLTTLEVNISFTLARYSTTGQLEWRKDLISTPIHFPSSARTNEDWYRHTRNINIDIDSVGNVYVLTPFIADDTVDDAHWYLAKFDPLGTLLWESYRSTPAQSIELPVALHVSADDRLYIHAAQVIDQTSIDSMIVAFDANGLERWSRPVSRFSKIGATSPRTIDAHTQFIYSKMSVQGIDVYMHYNHATVDTTTNELVSAWRIEKYDAQSALVWQYSDPQTRISLGGVLSKTETEIKKIWGTAGISILSVDANGNVLIQRGGLPTDFMEPMSAQKISATGTVLWKFASNYPFLATSDEQGNLYALELPDGSGHVYPRGNPWDTVFTHVAPDGKKRFSKYISMSQSVTSKALLSTSIVVEFIRDDLNRFYINLANLHCTVDCLKPQSYWSELIVLDAAATEISRVNIKGFGPQSFFDPANDLVFVQHELILKYDINTILGLTTP